MLGFLIIEMKKWIDVLLCKLQSKAEKAASDEGSLDLLYSVH